MTFGGSHTKRSVCRLDVLLLKGVACKKLVLET